MVVAQKMAKLQPRSAATHRPVGEVLIKRKKKGRNGEAAWEVVRAKGHLDEVLELRKGGIAITDPETNNTTNSLVRGGGVEVEGRVHVLSAKEHLHRGTYTGPVELRKGCIAITDPGTNTTTNPLVRG